MKETKLVLLKSCTLLLVDDEPDLRRNLEIMMGLFFGTVIIASNGQEALQIYQTKNIDVIMTDYVMPVMDGYTFCSEIRKENPNIPILILSNHTDREKLLKSIPLNLTSYLIKPVNFQELTKTLSSVTEKIKKEQIKEIEVAPGILFNQYTKQLHSQDDVIKLTKSEIILLELLLKNKNSIVSYAMIDEALSHEKPLSYQANKNLIYRLRKKIGQQTINSVQSMGYVLHLQPQ